MKGNASSSSFLHEKEGEALRGEIFKGAQAGEERGKAVSISAERVACLRQKTF